MQPGFFEAQGQLNFRSGAMRRIPLRRKPENPWNCTDSGILLGRQKSCGRCVLESEVSQRSPRTKGPNEMGAVPPVEEKLPTKRRGKGEGMHCGAGVRFTRAR